MPWAAASAEPSVFRLRGAARLRAPFPPARAARPPSPLPHAGTPPDPLRSAGASRCTARSKWRPAGGHRFSGGGPGSLARLGRVGGAARRAPRASCGGRRAGTQERRAAAHAARRRCRHRLARPQPPRQLFEPQPGCTQTSPFYIIERPPLCCTHTYLQQAGLVRGEGHLRPGGAIQQLPLGRVAGACSTAKRKGSRMGWRVGGGS